MEHILFYFIRHFVVAIDALIASKCFHHFLLKYMVKDVKIHEKKKIEKSGHKMNVFISVRMCDHKIMSFG